MSLCLPLNFADMGDVTFFLIYSHCHHHHHDHHHLDGDPNLGLLGCVALLGIVAAAGTTSPGGKIGGDI